MSVVSHNLKQTPPAATPKRSRHQSQLLLAAGTFPLGAVPSTASRGAAGSRLGSAGAKIALQGALWRELGRLFTLLMGAVGEGMEKESLYRPK